jgi:hypothetical protein
MTFSSSMGEESVEDKSKKAIYVLLSNIISKYSTYLSSETAECLVYQARDEIYQTRNQYEDEIDFVLTAREYIHAYLSKIVQELTNNGTFVTLL